MCCGGVASYGLGLRVSCMLLGALRDCVASPAAKLGPKPSTAGTAARSQARADDNLRAADRLSRRATPRTEPGASRPPLEVRAHAETRRRRVASPLLRPTRASLPLPSQFESAILRATATRPRSPVQIQPRGKSNGPARWVRSGARAGRFWKGQGTAAFVDMSAPDATYATGSCRSYFKDTVGWPISLCAHLQICKASDAFQVRVQLPVSRERVTSEMARRCCADGERVPF